MIEIPHQNKEKELEVKAKKDERIKIQSPPNVMVEIIDIEKELEAKKKEDQGFNFKQFKLKGNNN